MTRVLQWLFRGWRRAHGLGRALEIHTPETDEITMAVYPVPGHGIALVTCISGLPSDLVVALPRKNALQLLDAIVDALDVEDPQPRAS
jgi:hypothetical protein